MLRDVAILCGIGGLAQIAFAFFAFWRQGKAQKEIETAASDLTESVRARFEAGWPEEDAERENSYADLPGAAEYLRALGDLAAKLGGLSPPVAALLISTILFFFAAALAVVGELH